MELTQNNVLHTIFFMQSANGPAAFFRKPQYALLSTVLMIFLLHDRSTLSTVLVWQVHTIVYNEVQIITVPRNRYLGYQVNYVNTVLRNAHTFQHFHVPQTCSFRTNATSLGNVQPGYFGNVINIRNNTIRQFQV